MPNAFKPKVLLVLSTMILALIASAAPAPAWWEATGQQSKGQIKFAQGATFQDGSYTTECFNGNEIHGTWSIQTKGQIKQHGTQLQTKQGPDLLIQIKSWAGAAGACSRDLHLVKPTVTVTACELRLTQPKGSFEATAGFANTCVLEDPFCTVQIPAGMEKEPESNEGVNVGLKQVKLENKETKTGSNQLDKAFITGIQMNASCDLAEGEIGELKLPQFELIGVKAI